MARSMVRFSAGTRIGNDFGVAVVGRGDDHDAWPRRRPPFDRLFRRCEIKIGQDLESAGLEETCRPVGPQSIGAGGADIRLEDQRRPPGLQLTGGAEFAQTFVAFGQPVYPDSW